MSPTGRHTTRVTGLRGASKLGGLLAVAFALVLPIDVDLGPFGVGAGSGLGAGAASLLAQSDADPSRASESVPDELQEVAERFAQALRQGNADSLTHLFSESGIRLRLEGLDRSALSVRQVNAALRDFLRAYQPGQVRLVRAAPVEGNPGRGFAQLHWETRVAGTSHPVVHAVFLGLVREGESWRVDEFRLLP